MSEPRKTPILSVDLGSQDVPDAERVGGMIIPFGVRAGGMIIPFG